MPKLRVVLEFTTLASDYVTFTESRTHFAHMKLWSSRCEFTKLCYK